MQPNHSLFARVGPTRQARFWNVRSKKQAARLVNSPYVIACLPNSFGMQLCSQHALITPTI